MAEKDSYITGVGPYPVAPDTSVETFLQQYEGGYYNTPYRKRLLQTDKPGWVWEVDDFHNMKSAYEQWVTKLTNQYNADVKQWETMYNTPLSQSELLEAAGYNRNWLQGAANSRAQAADPYSPMMTEKTQYSPSDQLLSGFQNILSTVSAVMDMKDKQAGINLKQAQADQIEELLPFKMVSPYWQHLEKLKLHGIAPKDGNVGYLGFTPGQGITVSGVPEDSLWNSYQQAQLAKYQFTNAYISANTADRNWLLEHLRPYQEQLASLQNELLSGQVTLQDYNIKIREQIQEKLITEAKSKAIAGMIRPWFDMIIQGGAMILDFKKFGLQEMNFGLDWLKSTGELLPGMPGAE